MLAAVVMISVVSLICYIKTSHVSAAVMFVSSVLTIVSELVREFCPLYMRILSPQAPLNTVPMQILICLVGIGMFVFAVAFWRLLRHVAPQDEVR
jgi:hypothetical protein